MAKGREVPQAKRRMLWVGDAVAHTGFATVTDNIVRRLLKYWDIHVLGINYHGDPHDKPYRVFIRRSPAAIITASGGWKA